MAKKTKNLTLTELREENAGLTQRVVALLNQVGDLKSQLGYFKTEGKLARERLREDQKTCTDEWAKLREEQKKVNDQKSEVEKDELALRVGKALIESRRCELEVDRHAVIAMRDKKPTAEYFRQLFECFPFGFRIR